MLNTLSRFPPKLPSVSGARCAVKSSLQQETPVVEKEEHPAGTQPLPFPADDVKYMPCTAMKPCYSPHCTLCVLLNGGF